MLFRSNKLEDLPFAPQKLFIVDNYLEAVGVITALKTGVAIETVRRPLDYTSVHEIECKKEFDSIESKAEDIIKIPIINGR